MKLYDVIRKEKLENLEEDSFSKDKTEVLHGYISDKKPRFSSKKVAVIGLILVLLGIIYVIGIKFVHVRVTVFERRIPFSLEGQELELVHEKEASSEKLSFQTMVVSTEISREVYGANIESSISSAKGSVVFFNEYSKSTQTINSKTTITASNGKKYQTQSTVKVPGYTLTGKIKNPGTSSPVAIVASGTGPSYNNPGTSFTVPGRNSKQFYAQSTGSITGGEDGSYHVVSDEDKAKVVATLHAQLTERLKRETRTQIPENLIAFSDLQFVTIDADSMILKGESIRFPASVKGTMVTYLISRRLLETAIANNTIKDQTYSNVSIPNLGDMIVVPKTAIPTNPSNVPESIIVRISGQGTIIAKPQIKSIGESLIGARKKDFQNILSKFSEIETAKFNLYPFWSPLFPSKESSITIITK